jgi:glucan phosphoethanolaminetransferase (alkaline phosphatase superfamily)
MARLIILIAVAGIALILWHKISKAKGEQRKKMIMWSIISSVLVVLGLLAVTGHLNIITAMVAGAVALLPRAMQLLKYLPIVSRLFQQHGQQNAQNQQQSQPPPNGKQTMGTEQAMEVLGLKPGYSPEDVKQAHRRMMQKVHPDRGGSDYLAAQINQAKDVLLS